jgi:hypothetical protein
MILKKEIRNERLFLDLWWKDTVLEICSTDSPELLDNLESSYQYYRQALDELYEECAATRHQFYKNQCEACLIMAGSRSG